MYFRDNEENLKELAEKIRKQQIIPFFGAGVSADIFPTWKKYLESLIEPGDTETKKYVENQLGKADSDYEGILQYIEEQYGRAFYDKTQKAFDSRKISPDKLRPAIFELPRLFRGPMITTNLDQILERIYRECGLPVTVGLAGETGFIHDRMLRAESCLWKVHGDIDKTDSWVLTEDQYDMLYEKGDTSFLKLFHVFLTYKILLFIGASLKSDKIVGLLKALYESDHHICHYAILEAPENEEQFIQEQKRIWRLGVKPIWFTAKDGDYSGFDQIIYDLTRLTGSRFHQSYLPEKLSAHLESSVKRKHELKRIADGFAVSDFVVLSGMDGIGKTQLALNYACEETKEDVIFLRCTSIENFYQSLYDFLKWSRLLPDSVKIEKREYAVQFREALRRRSNFLVIFDGVADEEIFKYMETLPHSGRYLITTCRSSVEIPSASTVPVSGVTDEEAARLLVRKNPQFQEKLDEGMVAQLNHYCGGNVLWLEKAAAYMSETGEDIEHYLGEIVEAQKKTL